MSEFAPHQGLLAGKGSARRADIDVGFGLIGEGGPIEQRAVALTVGPPIGRGAGRHSVRFAGRGRRSVRVAGVGHDRQAFKAEGFLGRLGHPVKLASVIGLPCHRVMDDEAGVDIDSGLQVVGRRLALCRTPSAGHRAHPPPECCALRNRA